MAKLIVLVGRGGGVMDAIATAKYPKMQPPGRRGLSRVSKRVPGTVFRVNRSTTTAIGAMLPAEDSEAVRADLESSKRRARRLEGMFLREATSNG